MVPMASGLRQKNPADGGPFRGFRHSPGSGRLARGHFAAPAAGGGCGGSGRFPSHRRRRNARSLRTRLPNRAVPVIVRSRRQLAAGEGLADYGMKRPEDNGWRQRPGADRQQVPATLASGQRPTR